MVGLSSASRPPQKPSAPPSASPVQWGLLYPRREKTASAKQDWHREGEQCGHVGKAWAIRGSSRDPAQCDLSTGGCWQTENKTDRWKSGARVHRRAGGGSMWCDALFLYQKTARLLQPERRRGNKNNQDDTKTKFVLVVAKEKRSIWFAPLRWTLLDVVVSVRQLRLQDGRKVSKTRPNHENNG